MASAASLMLRGLLTPSRALLRLSWERMRLARSAFTFQDMKKSVSGQIWQIWSVLKQWNCFAAALKISHRRRLGPFYKTNDKNSRSKVIFGPILKTKVLLESPCHLLFKKCNFENQIKKLAKIRRFSKTGPEKSKIWGFLLTVNHNFFCIFENFMFFKHDF